MLYEYHMLSDYQGDKVQDVSLLIFRELLHVTLSINVFRVLHLSCPASLGLWLSPAFVLY